MSTANDPRPKLVGVNHIAIELLKSLAHLDIKHLPYRSGNAAATAAASASV